MTRSIVAILLLLAFASSSCADNLKEIGRKMLVEYDGTIVSVEQIDATACRVVVKASLSNSDCVATAENIGYFIRNATGSVQGLQPVVYVTKKGRQVAVARASNLGYVGKIEIKDLDRSGTGGEY